MVTLSSELELTTFHPEIAGPLECDLHLIHLVGTLHIYARSILTGKAGLFYHWDKVRAHLPALKHWISFCLTQAFHSAYHREHEIRGGGSCLSTQMQGQ